MPSENSYSVRHSQEAILHKKFQKFVVLNVTYKESATRTADGKLRINYTDCKSQKQSEFATLFINRREMMKVSVLQFLDLNEIFKFSMACKRIRVIVDPMECAKGAKGTRPSCYHLKLITSIQQFGSEEQSPSPVEIDKLFGISITKVRDYHYMNG